MLSRREVLIRRDSLACEEQGKIYCRRRALQINIIAMERHFLWYFKVNIIAESKY